jgi:uncharacterized protein (TIGR04222 family)
LIKRVGVTLEPLRNTLRARGLLLDEAAVHRLQRLSALPLAALTLFGIAKIAVGISRGKPIGFLFVLTLISAIAALVLLFKRTERTRAGDAAIAQLKESHARASRAPLPGEIPLAVALVGTGVLAGTAYAAYHEARAPSSSSDTSSSGSCSSSSDSGGGGDGGGGGGCGGCGGGGGD